MFLNCVLVVTDSCRHFLPPAWWTGYMESKRKEDLLLLLITYWLGALSAKVVEFERN